MGFQNSPHTNYTCKCQIEQAEVNTLGGDRSPWVRIWTAVGLATMVLFLACNILLFVWMKTAQEAYIANNIYLENMVNQLNADIKKVSAEQDCDDEGLGDQEEDPGYILRTARGTESKKGKNRKTRKGKSRRSRCKCQREIKEVENLLITKTKRSTTNSRPVTHLRGLDMTAARQSATTTDGKFLWKTPELFYASQFIYKKADSHVYSIQITTPGLYEIYSQVALHGTQSDVIERECGQEIIKLSGGRTTTLAKSFITQVIQNRGHRNEDTTGVFYPLDTSFQKGIFALDVYDEVYVKKNCNHNVMFIPHSAYTYFGVLLLVDYSNK